MAGVRHVTGPGLDRMDGARGDPGIVRPDTRVFTLHGHRALLRGREPVQHRLDSLGLDPAAVVFLGEREGVRYAARSIDAVAVAAVEREAGARFESLRAVAAWLPEWQTGLLYYAAGLLSWHAGALHCGACGAETRPTRGGHRRECARESCGISQFPRADPAIITLVRRGEQCLLARQPSWPPGRYSTLAGFVEPGESLEQAVAREVTEEVGLQVEAVEYFASQPWPFPHTLMVGFRTRAATGPLALGDEIEAARWFTRAGLRNALEEEEISIPPPLALSRSLIDDWLGGDA